MKYYEMHENAYQALKKQGYVSWDRVKDVKELFVHSINKLLEQSLKDFFFSYQNLSVLDLGTGTGTVALFLANLGFKVSGFDVSKTAIEMAKVNAEKLNLNADFLVKDLNLLEVVEHYDFIVDSSFLHCIVPQIERDQILSFVHQSLNEDGLFFVHTMIQSSDMTKMLQGNDYLVLEDDILWSTGNKSWDMDWQIVKNKKVFPHRRIKSLDKIEEEFSRTNFAIMKKEIKYNKGYPSTYSA